MQYCMCQSLECKYTHNILEIADRLRDVENKFEDEQETGNKDIGGG
jgi:hypothetical protein